MILSFKAPHNRIAIAFTVLLGSALLAFYGYQLTQVQQAQQDLFNLQQSTQRLAYLQASHPQPASLSTPLNVVIAESALRYRVTLITVKQEDDEVNIALSPLPFEQLIAWLAELQREHGIQVRTLQLTALPALGMVQTDALQLQRWLPN